MVPNSLEASPCPQGLLREEERERRNHAKRKGLIGTVDFETTEIYSKEAFAHNQNTDLP